MSNKGKYGKGSLYRRGSTWWLKYHKDGHVVRVSLSTAVKSEAERARDTLIRAVGNSPTAVEKVLVHALEEERRTSSFHLLATAWEERPYVFSLHSKAKRPLKPSSIANNRSYWFGFVRWMAEHYPTVASMEDVKQKHGEEWVKSIHANGGGPRSSNEALNIAGAIFRMAGLANPFSAIRRTQETRIGRRALTNDEIGRLVAASSEAGKEWQALIMIGVYTGMRLGDCCTLTWDSIDLDAGIVSRITAKTGSRVSLPLHPGLRRVLGELPRDGASVLPDVCRRYQSVPLRRWLTDKLLEIFKSAGIEVHMEIEGRGRALSVAGFHALRHSFVSACARAGIPEGVVRQWVGHGSLMVTRLYTHWAAADAAGIIRALPEFG